MISITQELEVELELGKIQQESRKWDMHLQNAGKWGEKNATTCSYKGHIGHRNNTKYRHSQKHSQARGGQDWEERTKLKMELYKALKGFECGKMVKKDPKCLHSTSLRIKELRLWKKENTINNWSCNLRNFSRNKILESTDWKEHCVLRIMHTVVNLMAFLVKVDKFQR